MTDRAVGSDEPEGMDAVIDDPGVALGHRRGDRRGHGRHGLGVCGEERTDLLHVELPRGADPAGAPR